MGWDYNIAPPLLFYYLFIEDNNGLGNLCFLIPNLILWHLFGMLFLLTNYEAGCLRHAWTNWQAIKGKCSNFERLPL